MNSRLYQILLATVAIVFCYACAKQSSPMGGPKDEEPPQLIESNPPDQSLNIKPENITLEFDEFIKTDNPTRNIIITPSLEKDKMEILAVKNTLRIKLNQELEDSTTYVFNFQKSIQDISESNPATNLKLVFSTGDMIDSLKFSGNLAYVFPQKSSEIKDVLVGLYRVEDDTMNVFTDPPYYISQADSAGRFEITNIKAGEYRAYAFYDGNNTSKAEFKSERYGFITDTIRITKNISGVHFKLFRGDLSDFKINRSSSIGNNYDIVLSKEPSNLHVEHPDLGTKLFYRIEEKQIRLFHNDLRNDSTQIKLVATDSVGFKIDTTLYAAFMESERKAQTLQASLDNNKEFITSIKTKITFNKPITEVNYDSLYIQYDSASFIEIEPEYLSFKDSSRRTELYFDIPIIDSLNSNNFNFIAADSSFVDIEQEYNSTALKTSFKRLIEDDLADEISGKILTEELPIMVQLITTDGYVVKEVYLTEDTTYSFKKVKAGEYELRAIIDRNGNRQWDQGNYLEKRQPEPVYYYFDEENKTRKILLRGRWTRQDLNIEKSPESGLDKPNNSLIDSLDINSKPKETM
ncbi:Ig-like domain-containing domain [Echinicola salinicaeni]|uniref:Ig-like domain-containing domain n=1 Tax=Echinicola salinicaeni TaxID=2762757 RepID=UPI0016484FEA|nr:Ig-like domain-containing domain [Echinicola salinicaeni]